MPTYLLTNTILCLAEVHTFCCEVWIMLFFHVFLLVYWSFPTLQPSVSLNTQLLFVTALCHKDALGKSDNARPLAQVS